jgi:hypothetical protein
MKIYNEREALYEQLDRERGSLAGSKLGNKDPKRLSINQKGAKNSSAEPMIRGHLS